MVVIFTQSRGLAPQPKDPPDSSMTLWLRALPNGEDPGLVISTVLAEITTWQLRELSDHALIREPVSLGEDGHLAAVLR